MPVFHVEEKITLKTWDDIASRPRYRSPVEPNKLRHGRIAAIYSFKEKIARCGVSDCLKEHSQGFLIIISDTKETNLCETCGQRLLNVTFNDQEKILRDQARISEHKIRLNTILEQSSEIKNRAKELKLLLYGANWLYRSLTNFKQAYPADLLSALRELAADKDDSDILSSLAENGADPFQLERVEQLQGLGIFAADIREVLIGNILKPLKELEELAGDPDANPSLTSYCKWADSLEEQFACAEYLVEEGRKFFTKENLERLISIPLSDDSARLILSLQWNCDKSMAKRK